MKKDIGFFTLKTIKIIFTVLLLSIPYRSYAGCQWVSVSELDNDINEAARLLSLYRDCSNDCSVIEDKYNKLSKKLGYFDPCHDNILKEEHIHKIREIFIDFRDEKKSKNNALLNDIHNLINKKSSIKKIDEKNFINERYEANNDAGKSSNSDISVTFTKKNNNSNNSSHNQEVNSNQEDCFANALKEGVKNRAKEIIEMYIKACEVAIEGDIRFCQNAFGQPYNAEGLLKKVSYNKYLGYINSKIDLELDIKDLKLSKGTVEIVDSSKNITCINVKKYSYRESLKTGLSSSDCLKNSIQVASDKNAWIKKIDNKILEKIKKVKELQEIINNSYPSNACSFINRSILETRLKDLKLEAASGGSYSEKGCFTKKVFFIDNYRDGEKIGQSKFGCSTQRDLNKVLSKIKREIRHISLILSLNQKQSKLCSC